MRYELSDKEWSIIRAMLPAKPRGILRVDDRRVLNGIFWVLRSDAPWRDLPGIYGPRTTCYNRFVRWRRAGVWDSILQCLVPWMTLEDIQLAIAKLRLWLAEFEAGRAVHREPTGRLVGAALRS